MNIAGGERFPGSISVGLLLTHGRSNRLFLTRHKDNQGWGLIAGGVEKGETAWDAAVREAGEEAGLKAENIIFVQGRNNLEPHVALMRREDKISLGLVFDTTYSGPSVPLKGWEIFNDHKVDWVSLFTWQQVLDLILNPEQIYRPEFNHPQLVRWTLHQADIRGNPRQQIINEWLLANGSKIPGLTLRNQSGKAVCLSDWEYVPPYNEWMTLPHLRGNPVKTNFARTRFHSKI